jgi:CheY-like chemotaxis protein
MTADKQLAHILVVDDEESLRDLSRVVLQAKGYTVTAVHSAQAAMESLANDMAVDLIVSDVNMPGEDGFDLIKQVRATFGDIPFIFLTASMWTAEGKKSALGHGAMKVIFRPIEIRAIVTEIEECLPVEKRSSKSL